MRQPINFRVDFYVRQRAGADISKVTVHSHGYGAGVIGVTYGTGLYIDWEGHSERQAAAQRGVLSATNSGLNPGAATTKDLVAAITGDNPSIKIAKNGVIAFMGCNSIALASHLSYELAQANRGDIQVIGATNKVYPKNGEPRVDHNGTFQTYQAGQMISETKRMKYK